MAYALREELLRRALANRLSELVSERIKSLRPTGNGPEAAFVYALQAQATRGGDSWPEASRSPEATAGGWMKWDGDCLEALKRLSLNEELQAASARPLPVEPFLTSLRGGRHEPERRFQLLLERYSCPLNIALDSEEEVREHLLERLMVQDRARLEKGTIEAAGLDDALLKLNLVAVYAGRSTDLRYLDALNYYYELRPESYRPEGRALWLYASYLGLYAQALSSWLDRKL